LILGRRWFFWMAQRFKARPNGGFGPEVPRRLRPDDWNALSAAAPGVLPAQKSSPTKHPARLVPY